MGSEYTPLHRFLYTPITATEMYSMVSKVPSECPYQL